MDFSNFWWQAAADPGPDPGDPINQSLRFRGAQDLVNTSVSLAGKPFTLSFWFKTARSGATPSGYANTLVLDSGAFGCNYGTNFSGTSDGSISLYMAGSASPGVESLSLHRDLSAWQHFVLTNDSLHINGVELTEFRGQGSFKSAGLYIGKQNLAPEGFEGYIASVRCVDGEALDPTTFGRYNAQGVWVPVEPQGLTYGNNGFHLTFEDPSNIGKDYSGNGNDFTATGFEVGNQSSVTYDLMQDSPTQNWSTLNPLRFYIANATLNANLGLQSPSGHRIHASTIDLSDGDSKYYAEVINDGDTRDSATGIYVGFCDSRVIGYPSLPGNWCVSSANNRGGIVADGATTVTDIDEMVGLIGDVYQIAFDASTNKAWVGKNNVWFNANGASIGDPANGTEEMFVLNKKVFSYIDVFNNKAFVNYGQQPFRFTPPAGFEALQTQNLPTDELPDEITGTFTGNSNANGPFVYTGCIPGRIQYGSVDVTYDQRLGQTDVDFLSNGFKVRSTNSNSGTVNYTVTTTHTGGEYDGKKIPFYLPAPATSN
jgi:hypothetical protein